MDAWLHISPASLKRNHLRDAVQKYAMIEVIIENITTQRVKLCTLEKT